MSKGQATLSETERKMIAIVQRQDRLLYLCLYTLLNLAEDVAVERKMRKKNVVGLLMAMFERSNVELLILAVTFLKKLSIYRENKDQMVKARGHALLRPMPNVVAVPHVPSLRNPVLALRLCCVLTCTGHASAA